MDGKKVKVLLISKAAAEGIDFKNIRQIHILDPWYNMNRIEQIIGRGVRNFSHCGLPLKNAMLKYFYMLPIWITKLRPLIHMYTV